MSWAAREGILSVFGVFVMNAVSFVLTGKSLPFSAEVIAGVVAITTAAVGITSAGRYMEYRQYSSSAQFAGQQIIPPTGMVGPPGGG